MNTRLADSDKCQCTIFNISRLIGNEFQKHEKAQRNNPGRPAEKVHEISSSITQYSNCHSEIGCGRPHEGTRMARQDNLVDLVRNHSRKTQEHVASKLLDAIYEDKGVSKQGGSTLLATKGQTKLVTVGTCRTRKPNPKYTIEDLSKLQVARNLSDNDMLAIASFLRVKGGRSCVEVNLKMNHKQKKKNKDCNRDSDCDDIDEQEELVDGMRDIDRPGIFAKDLDKFTQFLVEERCLDPCKHEVNFGLMTIRG